MTAAPVVYIDHNRHTCIQYAVTGDEQQKAVHAIYMESPELRMGQEEYTKFHRRWTQVLGSDPKDAAEKYLNGHIPFSHEVKSILENIMMANEAVVTTPNTNPVEAAVAKKKAAMPKAADPKKPGKAKVTDGEGKPKSKAKAKAEKEGDKKVDAFFKKAQENLKKKAGAEPAKGKGKEKAAPKETKAKAPGKPRVDLSGKVIHLLKGTENKSFREGSVRSQCFALIKDGMKVSDYLKAVAKKLEVEEPMAIDCLKKLSDPNQKVPAIALKDK